jgi:hypothetical protein
MSGLELAEALERAGVVVLKGSALGDTEHVRATLKSIAGADRLHYALNQISLSSGKRRTTVNGLAAAPRPAWVIDGTLEASVA